MRNLHGDMWFYRLCTYQSYMRSTRALLRYILNQFCTRSTRDLIMIEARLAPLLVYP